MRRSDYTATRRLEKLFAVSSSVDPAYKKMRGINFS
jgi:hypothetical protein